MSIFFSKKIFITILFFTSLITGLFFGVKVNAQTNQQCANFQSATPPEYTTSLGEAIFAYFRNRKSLLNCLWAGVSMGVGIWCFGCYLLLASQTKIEAIFSSRLLQFGSIPIPILQLHFTYHLLQLKRTRKRRVIKRNSRIPRLTTLQNIYIVTEY